MDFKLSKSQKEIQKAAWEFARGEFDKEQIIEISKKQEFPKNILKKAGELGFIGIHYPESVDGGGMGLFEYVLLAETFCRKDSTLGTALMFTAAKENDQWVINGKKTLVPFGSMADFYVVLCKTDPAADPPAKGMSLILVEPDRAGVSAGDISEKLGGRLVPFAEITFKNVHVPQSNLIGKEGNGYAQTQQFLTENRIQIAGFAIGIAQGAFDRALDYVRQREQFGKKLAQFQVTRHKLADMASKIEAARYLTYYTAWCFDNKKIDSQLASMAKMTAAKAAMEVTDEAVQLLGGYGYMTEYEVEHFYRDAKHAEIFQGTPAIQKDIIADIIIGKLK